MKAKHAPQERPSPVVRRQQMQAARIEEVKITTTADAPSDWSIPVVKVPGLRMYDRVNDPRDLLAFAPLVTRCVEYRYVAASEKGREPVQFRVSVACGRTAEDARQVMAWLMTRYSEPLTPVPGAAGQRLGDVAFASATMCTIFLVRGNVFVRVVSVGRAAASAEPLALAADAAILKSGPAGSQA